MKKECIVEIMNRQSNGKENILVTWHGKGYINIIASNTMADGML